MIGCAGLLYRSFNRRLSITTAINSKSVELTIPFNAFKKSSLGSLESLEKAPFLRLMSDSCKTTMSCPKVSNFSFRINGVSFCVYSIFLKIQKYKKTKRKSDSPDQSMSGCGHHFHLHKQYSHCRLLKPLAYMTRQRDSSIGHHPCINEHVNSYLTTIYLLVSNCLTPPVSPHPPPTKTTTTGGESYVRCLSRLCEIDTSPIPLKQCKRA